LADAYIKGTESLTESDRPENVILGVLRMVGTIEERGDGDDFFMKRVAKPGIIAIAKLRFWTEEQINEAIEEGRQIARLEESSEDDNNQE